MSNDKPIIAVWFSCGAASAVAAKLTLEKYSETHNVRIVNNPVVEEGEDNRRFREQVSAWLKCKIELAINPKYPTASAIDVWEHRRFMSARKGAPCTFHLKKEARYFWEKSNIAEWHVLGFTADEKHRFERFKITERKNTLAPLIDAGLTKPDCFDILKQARIRLPVAYGLGYANANCFGCVKATSPTYWNHLRRTSPGIFKSRAEQSRRLGAKLVRYKGRRIFLDELPADAKGRPLKSYSIDCGTFCEEKP